jgi:uncharacterized membrane protein HdeD (DUF308 family)
MSSFFQTVKSPDSEAAMPAAAQNPWVLALGVLSGVLLLSGLITVMIGLSALRVLSLVGAAAIVLGIVVGTCWLVLGAVRWDRRG